MKQDKRYYPERVYVDEAVAQSELVRTLRDALPQTSFETVSDVRALIESFNHLHQPLTHAKRHLLLTENKGQFLRKCPGSREALCCLYHVLEWASNCDMECSYCVLQTLLNNPLMVCFANVDEMLGEIDSVLDANPQSFYRIGTGEWTDSMTLDHLSGYSKILVPYFARKPNAILEIKTKTDNIANLLELEHAGKTVVSWSMNAQSMMESEEHKTASLEERLAAARLCAQAGYRIGFHFDPILRHPGWQEGYRRTIERIYQTVAPHQIAWISLGTLRFPPALKGVIQKRFPRSKILYEEFVRGQDGKMHYFRPVRVEIYRALVEAIHAHDAKAPVYLCMETPEVWQEVFDSPFSSRQELSDFLDQSVSELPPLKS